MHHEVALGSKMKKVSFALGSTNYGNAWNLEDGVKGLVVSNARVVVVVVLLLLFEALGKARKLFDVVGAPAGNR